MKAYAGITTRFEQYLANEEIAGAGILVYEAGETVYRHFLGFADGAKTIPVDENTQYWLASMTKPIAAAAFMKLVEQGEASLEDPVCRFLPSFSQEGKERVTTKMLLNHSCGLGMVGYPGMLTAMALCQETDDLKTRVERFARELPLDFEPGTRTLYSPTADFDILGRIMEVITKESLATYLQEAILGPLHMTKTTFLPDSAPSDQGGSVIAEPFLNRHIEGEVPALPAGILSLLDPVDARINGYFSAAAGLFGTALDYLQIAKMFVQEGQVDGIRILKPETVRLMRTPSNDLHPAPGITWGLGMQVFGEPADTGRKRAAGSYGWSGAIGTHFYVEPALERAVVLTTRIDNCGGSESYVSRGLEEEVFAAV